MAPEYIGENLLFTMNAIQIIQYQKIGIMISNRGSVDRNDMLSSSTRNGHDDDEFFLQDPLNEPTPLMHKIQQTVCPFFR